jgi:hypothetical protein
VVSGPEEYDSDMARAGCAIRASSAPLDKLIYPQGNWGSWLILSGELTNRASFFKDQVLNVFNCLRKVVPGS